MAISISCHGCGNTLFRGRDVISPYYVRAKNYCRCPKCGKKLSNTSMGIQMDLLKLSH